MNITFDEHEQGQLLQASFVVRASTGEIAKRLREMYQANFNQDLADIIAEYQQAEADEAKRKAEFRTELVRRFARKDRSDGDLANSLQWLEDGLELVTTAEAFALARAGKEVYQVYADGTDTLLDDLETEDEYYPDKTKSWPEIETIMVIEVPKGKL